MEMRQLGRNGPMLTTVGLGTWAIGGPWEFGWGPQDEADSVRAIRAALETGVNWIDTAAVYGFGRSEETVARAIEGRRDEIFIATKCGRTWNERGENFRNLRPESMRREIDESLRRLGTDRVDLYQIHWPDTETGTPVEESWGVMKEIRDAGKARFIGVSNFDVPLLERCGKIAPVQSLQPPYSLIRRDIEEGILPYCRENGIGVVAYSPMASGLLTGRFSLDRLAADDWRRRNPRFQEPQLSRHLSLVEAIRPIAQKHGRSVANLAVAWVLSRPGITSAIVGARTPEQAQANAGAAGWRLSADEAAQIKAALAETEDTDY